MQFFKLGEQRGSLLYSGLKLLHMLSNAGIQHSMEAPRFDTNGMCIKERISKFSKVLANVDMETVLVKNELILCLKGHFALTVT